MLKIKDNVSLEELMKYGIKPIYDCNHSTGEIHIRCLISDRYAGKYGALTFTNQKKKGLRFINRILDNINSVTNLYIFEDNTYVDVDLLYDLIKADLVEKC